MITFKKATALQTLHKRQAGIMSSKFIKQNMIAENILRMISNSENLLFINDSDLKKWFFNGSSYWRGYHKYMILIRDVSLILKKVECKKGNVCDPHVVAIIWRSIVVGHVPQKASNFYWKVLYLPNTSICVRVLSKKINRGVEYGLQIPIYFVFQGHEKGVEWIKKKIDEAEKKVQTHSKK